MNPLSICRLALLCLPTVSFALPSAYAQGAAQAPAPIFTIPEEGTKFLSGDTWQQNGQTFRLYGVQSCLRGTSYTDMKGNKQDCGTVSLAMLAAIIRDTKPKCSAVAEVTTPDKDAASQTILAICSGNVGGEPIDLGMAIITQGYGFAAFANDAKPVYTPYLVGEATAKQAKAGLWAYPDIPHPNHVLFGAMQNRVTTP